MAGNTTSNMTRQRDVSVAVARLHGSCTVDTMFRPLNDARLATLHKTQDSTDNNVVLAIALVTVANCLSLPKR